MAAHFFHWDEPVPEACRGGVLAIGNFDGVHRGHQEILAVLDRQARELGGPAVAVTFDPHPLQLLRPQHFQPLLSTLARRAELLLEHGAAQVAVLATTPDLLQLSAAEFFERVVQGGFQTRGLVEGSNFCFGRNRQGTVATLNTFCSRGGIELRIVPPLELEGRPISSSRVRQELIQGAVRQACRLLGRPFRLSASVGQGQGRGQTLGFPTANLEGISTLIPGDGVYAVRVLYQGQSRPGAANIGPNPTFGEQARKVEIHLLDFQGDLYGQTLVVDFIDRLRDTHAFRNAQELAAQLERDVGQVRRLVSP